MSHILISQFRIINFKIIKDILILILNYDHTTLNDFNILLILN